MGKFIEFVMIAVGIITALSSAFPSDVETLKKPKEPYLVEEVFGDMSNDKTSPLWQELNKCLPDDAHYFGVQGAWIDKEKKTAVCVYCKHEGPGIIQYEYKNAYAAIINTTEKGYICRQIFEIWESEGDTRSKERLSLPMQYILLDKKINLGFMYSYASIYILDIDGDRDNDLCIVLYNRHCEIIVLQNNDGEYSIILSKTGSYESDNFGEDIKYQNRFGDLDKDGIPELFIWDELIDPGCNAEFRCWMDIYHWNGKRMAICNSKFPEMYANIKKEFLKICEKYESCFKHYYHLGVISLYEKKPDDAVYYLNKCLDCENCVDAYAEAAHEKLKEVMGE